MCRPISDAARGDVEAEGRQTVDTGGVVARAAHAGHATPARTNDSVTYTVTQDVTQERGAVLGCRDYANEGKIRFRLHATDTVL